VLDLLAPALRARQGPTHWIQAVVGQSEAAAGRTRDAEARLAGLAAEGFADVPKNLRWTATLIELAHLAADLEAETPARALAKLLAPYADHHAVLPLAVNYGGPASFALARLAALRGERAEARSLAEDALAATKLIGAEPMRARIERWCDGGGERGRAGGDVL
jgi:hypothetical protein